MRKNFTLIFILFYFGNAINAQHVDLKQVIPIPYKGTSRHSSPNGSCDSLNLYNANEWPAFYYEYRGGGSVLGTNELKATKDAVILENAGYFDVSSSNYNFITGGLVYFAYANTDVPANLNKNITFKIYDNADGSPNSLLGSASLTLGQVHEDVVNGNLTEFKLTSPIALPSSKKFYVSVDLSNFSWSFLNHDSIAIVATGNHATTGTAYQYINFDPNTQWTPVNQFWRSDKDSLDVSMYIFPYVRNSLDNCSVLPVNIFNFGGIVKNYQAYLKWGTATESNSKGFYIERSKDGQNFTSIGFVNGAGNSSKIINYAYVDISLKDMNVTTTYYRLKQVDLDGKYSYSKVLPLNLDAVAKWRLYPNPVKDITTVELHLDAASKVKAQVISNDGRIVLNLDKGILSEGIQLFPINTQNFAKGAYIVRVTVGDKTYALPIVKE